MARFCSSFHASLLVILVCYCTGPARSNNCTLTNGMTIWRGDGDCDWENNNAECGYDWGDCCESTCWSFTDFPCGISGYLCMDPYSLGNDDGQKNCSQDNHPYPMGLQEWWLIENTEDVQALAEAVKCSGRQFQVQWSGHIVVPATLEVMNGTVLNITGVGSEAMMDGNGTTRLFRVVDAFLTLTNVEIWNGNATYGGALAASGSTITLNRTTFVNNIAFEKRGGALFAYDGSVLTFSGETRFYNNSGESGGAVFISSGSNALWAGDTTFSNNTAFTYGGAVAVVHDSSASWTGKTTFLGNTVSNYGGGAISVEDGSRASWTSDASFIANHAEGEGGAIYVDSGSDVTMNADALFSHNTVRFNGGAVLIGYVSTVSWTKQTDFVSNYAGSVGGAVASRAIDSGANPSSAYEDNLESFLLINGPTAFVNNMCRGNGGAMALLGGLFVNFLTKELTFSGNEANVAGGGIFISATGVGPEITNASFLSNFAEIGAGAFMTGSGTSTNHGNDSPTTFKGCRFVGNKAGATGGAIESAVGIDAIIDTVFIRNIARVGGALRLAGKASIEGCSFEENVAALEGGPAVHNIGYISEMSNCHFNGNVFDCKEGAFLSSTSANSVR